MADDEGSPEFAGALGRPEQQGVYDLRTMRLRLLYFGVLRELMDTSAELIDVQDAATVGELLRLSEMRASNLGKPQSSVWSTLAVAVNREYVGRATVLGEGDEVALLPPVSGGVFAGVLCESRLLTDRFRRTQ